MFIDEKREGEAVEVKLEPWQQWCLDAAQYIRDHGWCKNTEQDMGGRVCMVGALLRTGSPEVRDWEIIQKAFDFQVFGGTGRNPNHLHARLFNYNDCYGRTASQVIMMLETMAKGGK